MNQNLSLNLQGLVTPLTSLENGHLALPAAHQAQRGGCLLERVGDGVEDGGTPLLPTRTSASTSRCSNRTSIVGMSMPSLRDR